MFTLTEKKKNHSRLSFKLRWPESHLFHDLIEEENSDNEEPENPPIGICRENTHSKNCFKDRRQMCKNIKALINVIELGGNLLTYIVWFFGNMIKWQKSKVLILERRFVSFFLALKQSEQPVRELTVVLCFCLTLKKIYFILRLTS